MGGSVSRVDDSAARSVPASTDQSPQPETPPGLLQDPTVRRRGNSSLENIVPTIFNWGFGGHDVYITGAWDKWETKVALARPGPGADHSTVLSLPVGTYQYKFIVDGNWKHSPALPCETDQHGNVNNCISVSPHLPEYDSNQLPTNIGGPPSPVESYDFSMPAQEDYSAEPMALPILFKSMHPDPLPVPQAEDVNHNPASYVALNHTYAVAASHPSEPVRTLCTMSRYKTDKYVTTVLIINSNTTPTIPVAVPVAQPTSQRLNANDHHEPSGYGTNRAMAIPGQRV